MRRSRQGGQAIVEFGLICILFTLLMFAVVDFGLLLNVWLTVSSDAQQLARDAATGAYQSQPPNDLDSRARSFPIAGVTPDAFFTGGYCCQSDSALVLTVTYYNQCTPDVGGCLAIPLASLDSWYGRPAGQCPHGSGCRVPVRPSTTGPGDSVVVVFRAAGAQIITPLVRPFFRDNTYCPDYSAHCYVSVSSRVTVRFDGAQF